MKIPFMVFRLFSIALMGFGGWAATLAGGPEPFPFNDGERILVIGNGLVENDQRHAFFETRLQRRHPKVALTFRYMGWSGDTVRASARTAGFQVPERLARLEKEAIALKPTVIFLAYGMNESFDGPDKLDDFLRDYDTLLKTLEPLKARLVIVSPTFHEDLGRPFPDPAEHNRHLQQYTKALKTLAQKRNLPFVDLYHPLESAKKADAKLGLTTNGILLTKNGYALIAQAIEKQLGYAPHKWVVTIDRDAKVTENIGTKLSSSAVREGSLRFEANDTMLSMAADACTLRVKGLAAGEYTLKVGGQEIIRAPAADWENGVNIAADPVFADAEKLRAAIVERNQLFYRRWRPYNDHSRHWGFIGGDFKLYDKDIAEQEQRIGDLRTPRPRTFELTRKGP